MASRADDELEMPVAPEARDVPLYEGRMVHQFEHAAKERHCGCRLNRVRQHQRDLLWNLQHILATEAVYRTRQQHRTDLIVSKKLGASKLGKASLVLLPVLKPRFAY